MSVYDNFFANISPNEWEYFAQDFLCSLGYQIVSPPAEGPDGGKDFIVFKDNIRWLVSCKHYHQSGKSVGTDIETSILDRVVQHGTRGFIGFYSTMITTGLQQRFNSFQYAGYPCRYYVKDNISDLLPSLDSFVLQKYGLPNDIQFVMNVGVNEYSPLYCMGSCARDLLTDDLIPYSMVTVHKNQFGNLVYLYGCKDCISNYGNLGDWAEMRELLHLDRLLSWNNTVSEFAEKYPVDENFWKAKDSLQNAVLQRLYPSNWGRYPVANFG